MHRNEPRTVRVNLFLSTDDYLRAAELAELRGFCTSTNRPHERVASRAVARFVLHVIARELAAADDRLARGVPDVSATRKHRRELARVPIAIAHLPRRKPLQTVSKTATNRSARGPQ